jgi:hypothetical protein
MAEPCVGWDYICLPTKIFFNVYFWIVLSYIKLLNNFSILKYLKNYPLLNILVYSFKTASVHKNSMFCFYYGFYLCTQRFCGNSARIKFLGIPSTLRCKKIIKNQRGLKLGHQMHVTIHQKWAFYSTVWSLSSISTLENHLLRIVESLRDLNR